jgi:uncharacterized protein YdhG (YjbR/CyaY superfamily)
MRIAKSVTPRSATKRKPAPKTVAEYLAAVPEPARTTLKKLRADIRAIAPKDATEGISYRIPMFKHKGMLMGYAAFSNHCSLFPGAIVENFKIELTNYRTAKGTIQFPVDKPFPVSLLKKLIKARISANESKKRR